MYVVYILKSRVAEKTYVGHTDNLERRLIQHNNGNSIFSKRYRPWEIIYSDFFATLEEVIKREKYFKSAVGRRWMKKNLFTHVLK
ncbi:GIY-YIG nuclease family protein [Candidatus Microgenomates bacterium]|nr:GIY-YIG nuclease family protein [Candidatus Microgenomates bacterium]